MKHKDYTYLLGQTFGMLKVIRLATLEENKALCINKSRIRKYALCKCQCGKEKFICIEDFVWKQTQSCGCMRKPKKRRKHQGGTRILHTKVKDMTETEFINYALDGLT